MPCPEWSPCSWMRRYSPAWTPVSLLVDPAGHPFHCWSCHKWSHVYPCATHGCTQTRGSQRCRREEESWCWREGGGGTGPVICLLPLRHPYNFRYQSGPRSPGWSRASSSAVSKSAGLHAGSTELRMLACQSLARSLPPESVLRDNSAQGLHRSSRVLRVRVTEGRRGIG